jgi:hypothetical protein
MSTLNILVPVYNDWEALNRLLVELSALAAGDKLRLQVMVVNDGSTLPPAGMTVDGLKGIDRLEIVHLVRNLGSQRAIAMGLALLNARETPHPTVVMDGDGEDQPADILRLLAEHGQDPDCIVFARRARRSEGLLFRFFYFFFKLIFSLFTGKQIAFGNFCLIPADQVGRVAHLQELWNHFAAGIMHSGIPWTTIPTVRGKRHAGKSKMNLITLVLHGLSAISVHIEIVYARLLFLSFGLILLDLAGFLVLLYIRFATPLAIPGWATNVTVGLTVVMVQAVLFLALLSFVVLSYRSSKMFIPAIDYKDYLLRVETICS